MKIEKSLLKFQPDLTKLSLAILLVELTVATPIDLESPSATFSDECSRETNVQLVIEARDKGEPQRKSNVTVDIRIEVWFISYNNTPF